MFRCILFTEIVPYFVMRKDEVFGKVMQGESDSPEGAMWEAVKQYIPESDSDWVRQTTTWQPSSGMVFVNGEVCGTVFRIKETPHRGTLINRRAYLGSQIVQLRERIPMLEKAAHKTQAEKLNAQVALIAAQEEIVRYEGEFDTLRVTLGEKV